MLRPRIIPSLLIHDKGLVKTVNFKSPKYVGDPINAVRIFNEKEVDELAIFDIDATILDQEPDYVLIEKLANQSRMPLCYGGGVKTVEQAIKDVISINYPNKEIIVIDNCSKDGRAQIIKKLNIPFDMIYIDAHHDYESVLHDITVAYELWPNAIIIGDDYGWPRKEISRAVHEFADANNLNVKIENNCWYYVKK
jgi:cellulose synthase/poly-beta-1,6-N-acetylglucosamine synthase-like glycosyltransferase